MREIKFRAWDGKKFGYVSIGYDRISWPSPDYFEQTFSGVREGSPEQVRFMSVEGFQQLTGLRDKNGKEIYEGDIVRSPGGPIQGVVVWQAPAFVMKDRTKNGYSKRWSEFVLAAKEKQFQEVIGNIYENPELLTGLETKRG